MRLPDGWLIGFDAGEFGGGLWWFSSDGKRRRKLIHDRRYQFPDNVVGMARRESDVLVLQGLAHSTNRGGVSRVGMPLLHELHVIANLRGKPLAFTEEPNGGLLVVTSKELFRVKLPGSVERIATVPFERISPNSLLIDGNENVWFGMRHFVVIASTLSRLTTWLWLVPEDCAVFAIGQLSCVCGQQP